uniref:Uncharacterized protein n=1 Tax=Steinernema glaseri TaxID=37863 RepID=A0A1I7YU55_9BILA
MPIASGFSLSTETEHYGRHLQRRHSESPRSKLHWKLQDSFHISPAPFNVKDRLMFSVVKRDLSSIRSILKALLHDLKEPSPPRLTVAHYAPSLFVHSSRFWQQWKSDGLMSRSNSGKMCLEPIWSSEHAVANNSGVRIELITLERLFVQSALLHLILMGRRGNNKNEEVCRTHIRIPFISATWDNLYQIKNDQEDRSYFGFLSKP